MNMNLYQRMNNLSCKISKSMDKLFAQLKFVTMDEELRLEREENMKLLAEMQTLINIMNREVGVNGERH